MLGLPSLSFQISLRLSLTNPPSDLPVIVSISNGEVSHTCGGNFSLDLIVHLFTVWCGKVGLAQLLGTFSGPGEGHCPKDENYSYLKRPGLARLDLNLG
jgi:hypothetical protein